MESESDDADVYAADSDDADGNDMTTVSLEGIEPRQNCF